jgi:hypothetical protein
MNWRAAIYAGLAAGTIATLAQLVLWAAFTDALPSILYRDARLAAAIVMGRSVLTPPAEWDPRVMVMATLVHFALSVLYVTVLAAVIAHRSTRISLVTGLLFGIALYAVNMYGFTYLFPWFQVARDPITLAAHIVFGVSAAAVYRWTAGTRPRSGTR